MIPLEWIYQQFKNGQSISKDSLQNLLEDNLAQQVLLTLNFLTSQGIVSHLVIKGRSNYGVQDINALRELLDDLQAVSANSTSVLKKTVDDAQRTGSTSNEIVTDALVVSAPLSLRGKLRTLRARYSQLAIEETKEAFRKLLMSARYEVFLSVPFLELDGVMTFVDEIERLGNRQVAIKALTRELLAPARTDYGYYQKLRAFSKLIDVYISGGGDPESIEVRDYTIKIGGAGDRGLIYEGIHQKMIVIDRTWAYVGSGEIRMPSFIVNGDVGIIQSGLSAKFWAEYFLLFWSEAQKINHQFFRSSQS